VTGGGVGNQVVPVSIVQSSFPARAVFHVDASDNGECAACTASMWQILRQRDELKH
jgi:hypothetical protein